MKLTGRSWILIFIFVAGLFCRVAIYSHSQFNPHSVKSLAWVKKNRETSDTVSEAAFQRLLKSKRRIEKIAFAKDYISIVTALPLYLETKALTKTHVDPLRSVESSSPFQPPRA